MIFPQRFLPLVVAIFVFPIAGATAAESPFFLTYTHQMEEPGNLEFALKSVTARPSSDSNRFWGAAAEFEYGLIGWWTTEVYLDGQTTGNDSTVFTGYRWENRFRILPREYWINPVLYFEFENINGADKALLEVVGHDGKDDLADSNAASRLEKKRELEAKLILSSHVKGWTIAENFIAEKNIRHEPYEFGYSVGASRPLAFAARPQRCEACPENIQVGVELYGGLGTHRSFGLAETSHYLAPVLSWSLTDGTTLRVSPGFGLTGTSTGFLFRVSVSHEFRQVGRRIHEVSRKDYDR